MHFFLRVDDLLQSSTRRPQYTGAKTATFRSPSQNFLLCLGAHLQLTHVNYAPSVGYRQNDSFWLEIQRFKAKTRLWTAVRVQWSYEFLPLTQAVHVWRDFAPNRKWKYGVGCSRSEHLCPKISVSVQKYNNFYVACCLDEEKNSPLTLAVHIWRLTARCRK